MVSCRNFAWFVNKLVKLSVYVITKTGKYIGTWGCSNSPVVYGTGNTDAGCL